MTKPSKRSAGLLLYRKHKDEVEVFLVHPGGPFWAKKDRGAWTIPKGEYDADEEPLAVAQREFQEETGFVVSGRFVELGSIRQKSGSSLSPGPSKATVTLLNSRATHVRLNGLQDRARR